MLIRREDGAYYLDCSEDLLLLDLTNDYVENHFYDIDPFNFNNIWSQYDEAATTYVPSHIEVYDAMPLIYQIPPPITRIVFDGVTIFWFVVATLTAGQLQYTAHASY